MATPSKTFFFQQKGGAFYLIRDGASLPPGPLDLRSLRGAQLLVDEQAVKPYEVDQAAAHAHLKTQLYAKLGSFGEGLREAWRRGRGKSSD